MAYLLNVSITEVLIGITVGLICWLWMRSRRPADFPPGPIPLPLIGNVHQLSGGNIVKAFRRLRKEYGDIFSLSIGSSWVVVVNGANDLRELLLKRGDSISDRPNIFILKLRDNHGIIASNGTTWRQQRTFAHLKLRDFGFGRRSFESSISEEVDIFLKYLEDLKGKPFDVSEKLNISVSNNVMSIIIGRRFDYDDPKFKYFIGLLTANFKNAALAGPLYFFPILAKLPGDMFGAKKIVDISVKLRQFYRDEIAEHKASFDENNIRDFTDAYLKEIALHKNEKDTTFTEKQLMWLISDFFTAGTETTSTTLRWAMVFLLNNPKVQTKMRKEIEDVIGSGRPPQLSDQKNLNYCVAVIHEVLRLGNISPTSLPHSVSEDVFYKGYKIPKGAIVMPMLDSVLSDESNFPNSHEFIPERFIDNDGNLVDLDKVIAFSIGKRNCTGESLARMELFLYLTSLIQRFELVPPEGEDPPTLEGFYGTTHSPLPFTLRVLSRHK
ncbi:cytochrome P450 2E1-like [Mytilus galloprovincialis]|uniref:cytochrome P450 2E1-like n=1 Tax=Mytilus galloprovincialis TaxID=29158 RepID=UPI003F7C6BDE